jgi:hypothetical protein
MTGRDERTYLRPPRSGATSENGAWHSGSLPFATSGPWSSPSHWLEEEEGIEGNPLAYQYQPGALAQRGQLAADTLHVVGGLYGNLAALRTILRRAELLSGTLR